MMNAHIPLTQDLVLIGGGHTHALVLRKWGMNPLPGVRLTVINPGPTAAYSGMLPGFVAGHYTRDELDIDLVKLCRFAGARLVLGAANHIDRDARTVLVSGQPAIPYDALSLDMGITSDMPLLTGFTDHAVPAKPLGTFAAKWDDFRSNASRDTPVAVIGGGVAGAELAMAMQHGLTAPTTLHLIDKGDALTHLGRSARAKITARLAASNVTLHENASIDAVTPTGITLSDGRFISATFITGAAGAKPYDWLSDIGVTTTDGYINVNPQLQSSDVRIFAVGDCAHMETTPRPKAGVFAVRQAPVLFENLRAVLSGGALATYKPQRDYLKLISLGSQTALAEKFGVAVAGPLLWRWKNQIDRKFMDQFDGLPAMADAPIPALTALGVNDALGDAPMCGGCGAKVGRAALQDALAAQSTVPHPDVLSVAGDDAAIVQVGDVQQVFTTDHLRAFTHDYVAMTRIAALHALGDIWAMGGAAHTAVATLILPPMSPALQHRTTSAIMEAAHAVMGAHGAAIVGGHTSLGTEMTIGFAVTGKLNAPAITIAGGKAGDALILTKPIGSGVILAAEMAGLARGADVSSCLTWMQTEQATAARLLGHAHAMTDVTGFGLAGHLAGICSASGASAEIMLDQVPLMDGALALSTSGVRSTLYSDNVIGAGTVAGATGPRGDLLFDPQTAGGMLASIAPDRVATTLDALQVAGYPAVVIGHLRDGDPAIKVV